MTTPTPRELVAKFRKKAERCRALRMHHQVQLELDQCATDLTAALDAQDAAARDLPDVRPASLLSWTVGGSDGREIFDGNGRAMALCSSGEDARLLLEAFRADVLRLRAERDEAISLLTDATGEAHELRGLLSAVVYEANTTGAVFGEHDDQDAACACNMCKAIRYMVSEAES